MGVLSLPDIQGESIDGKLLFAIPKKGRLHEKCVELLNGADIQFRRSHRLDVCLCLNLPIALVFLPAADIPSFVGKGSVDIGITGQDVILESRMEEHTKELLKLGFGKCSLQVQVPIVSEYKTVEDLSGRRIVTSYEVLAGQYFNAVDERVAAEKQKSGTSNGDANGVASNETKVEYVGGSVEAACALGLADAIVDLVESGDTMRAAGLHAIATILPSEAVLISSSTTKPNRPDLNATIQLVKNRIAGVVASAKYVLCQYNIRRGRLAEAEKITPGRRAPTISPLEDEDWVAVSSMVEKKIIAKVMDELVAVGAEDVLILQLDNCRV